MVVEHSERLQLAQPVLFTDIIGNGIFDDDNEDQDKHQDFNFDNLIPILEDDKDDDPIVHSDDTNDEGEIDPPMPTMPQPGEEEAQPPVLRPTSPSDQRCWITTPRQLLPAEGEKDKGAVDGEVWETPAMLDAQREF